eukprot:5568546-Pyramimonas_sp.AAC.1
MALLGLIWAPQKINKGPRRAPRRPQEGLESGPKRLQEGPQGAPFPRGFFRAPMDSQIFRRILGDPKDPTES